MEQKKAKEEKATRQKADTVTWRSGSGAPERGAQGTAGARGDQGQDNDQHCQGPDRQKASDLVSDADSTVLSQPGV